MQIQVQNKNQRQVFPVQNPKIIQSINQQELKLAIQFQKSITQIKFLKQNNSARNSIRSSVNKFQLYSKLKKVIHEARKNLESYRNQNINQLHLTLINDKGSNLDFGLKNNKKTFKLVKIIQNFLQFVLNILDQFPLIQPSSKLKLIWDLLIGLIFFCYFIIIPLFVTFNLHLQHFVPNFIGFTMQSLMILDIILSLNTGFYQKGVSVTDKQEIIQYYIKNYVYGDIVAQLPLLYNNVNSYYYEGEDYFVEKIIMLLFFVKIRNVLKIFSKFEDSFHLNPQSSNIISLFKLLFTILFVSHIFSCVWIIVGQGTSSETTNWIRSMQISDTDLVGLYINAYYFSTVTMITVGYGDISPKNKYEKIVSICSMMISCGVFAYSLNQIGTIFSDLFAQEKIIKNHLYTINDFMYCKKINFDLQYKVREYLNYYWNEQNGNQLQLQEQIIGQLSHQLGKQLMMEANSIVLKDSPIFKNNFCSLLLEKIVPLIQIMQSVPEQIIFHENQNEDNFIYFIEKGKVEIYQEIFDSRHQNSIKILTKGQCFGEQGFFTNMRRSYIAKSLEFTKLLYIKRNEFLEILKEFPQDFERFHEIKDSILYERQYENVTQKCFSCASSYHQILECPFLHYKTNHYSLIAKFNKQNNVMSRIKIKRIKKKRQFLIIDNYNFIMNKYDLVNEYIQDHLQNESLNSMNLQSPTKTQTQQFSPSKKQKQGTLSYINEDFNEFNHVFSHIFDDKQKQTNNEEALMYEELNCFELENQNQNFLKSENSFIYPENINLEANNKKNLKKETKLSDQILNSVNKQLIQDQQNQLIQPQVAFQENKNKHFISVLAEQIQKVGEIKLENQNSIKSLNHLFKKSLNSLFKTQNSIKTNTKLHPNTDINELKAHIIEIIDIVQKTSEQQQQQHDDNNIFIGFYCINEFEKMQNYLNYFQKQNCYYVLQKINNIIKINGKLKQIRNKMKKQSKYVQDQLSSHLVKYNQFDFISSGAQFTPQNKNSNIQLSQKMKYEVEK